MRKKKFSQVITANYKPVPTIISTGFIIIYFFEVYLSTPTGATLIFPETSYRQDFACSDNTVYDIEF